VAAKECTATAAAARTCIETSSATAGPVAARYAPPCPISASVHRDSSRSECKADDGATGGAGTGLAPAPATPFALSWLLGLRSATGLHPHPQSTRSPEAPAAPRAVRACCVLHARCLCASRRPGLYLDPNPNPWGALVGRWTPSRSLGWVLQVVRRVLSSC
jgi:hypothetical protein